LMTGTTTTVLTNLNTCMLEHMHCKVITTLPQCGCHTLRHLTW
jgi:hypothetical protein